jgi:hypothetical protein
MRRLRWIAAGLGAAAGGYAMLVATAWSRYGRAGRPQPDEADTLMDRFMPEYDVAERHHTRVRAPADVTLTAARDADMQASPVVRAIFSARELLLRAAAQPRRAKGIVDETTALGWVILAEIPGREIVLGAVTRPWVGAVVFRSIPPESFLAFDEPDYAKIVWNLRADPDGPAASVFRTETRVATTDASARRKFRWYWARFSPGIVLIRWLLLPSVKREAERRTRRSRLP